MDDHSDEHTGSRWDLHIRDGLVDAKHRKAMGEAVWLYLYLHKHVGFETGLMPRYRHDIAAAELELPLRTVKFYMQRLVSAGYVTVTQSRYGCKVEITRYRVAESPPDTTQGVQSAALLKPGAQPRSAKSCTPGVQKPARGTLQQSLTQKPLSATDAASVEDGGVCTQTRQHDGTPSQSPRPKKPPSAATVVAETWMRAEKIDPSKASGQTIMLYRTHAKQMLDRGYVQDDLCGCIRFLASKRAYDRADFTLSASFLDRHIGAWLDRPGHPETFEPSPPPPKQKPKPAPYQPRAVAPADAALEARVQAEYARIAAEREARIAANNAAHLAAANGERPR